MMVAPRLYWNDCAHRAAVARGFLYQAIVRKNSTAAAAAAAVSVDRALVLIIYGPRIDSCSKLANRSLTI